MEYTRRHQEKQQQDVAASVSANVPSALIKQLTPEEEEAEATAHLGGSVLLADYCPFMQQVIWSVNGDIRDSKCTIDENKPADESKNYVLEEYSARSKCILHDRTWNVYTDECRSRISVSKTVGCYQVRNIL